MAARTCLSTNTARFWLTGCSISSTTVLRGEVPMPSPRALQVISPDKAVLQTWCYKMAFLELGLSLAIFSAALGLHLEFHVLTCSLAASCSVLALACTNVGNWKHRHPRSSIPYVLVALTTCRGCFGSAGSLKVQKGDEASGNHSCNPALSIESSAAVVFLSVTCSQCGPCL